MRRDSIEIDGKGYATTKVMAGVWGVSQRTASRYCRDGLVAGAFKDSSNRYLIPVDTRKPLSRQVIEKVLWLVIQLKNAPAFRIDYAKMEIKPEQLVGAFYYLADLGLVSPPGHYPAKEIPYRVSLTRKGVDFIRNQKDESGTLKTVIDTILQLMPSLIKLVIYALGL